MKLEAKRSLSRAKRSTTQTACDIRWKNVTAYCKWCYTVRCKRGEFALSLSLLYTLFLFISVSCLTLKIIQNKALWSLRTGLAQQPVRENWWMPQILLNHFYVTLRNKYVRGTSVSCMRPIFIDARHVRKWGKTTQAGSGPIILSLYVSLYIYCTVSVCVYNV